MKLHTLILVFVVTVFTMSCNNNTSDQNNNKTSFKHVDKDMIKDEAYVSYINFFEEVYDTMTQSYYKPIARENFDRFIDMFNNKIYAQLKGQGKSNNFVKWRSTAFLIDHLKDSEDIFSAFFPPKPAKEYEQTALGKRVDLGIEGELKDAGYLVSNIEPRADAYDKGLRKNDLILKIDDRDVLTLEKEVIEELLRPMEGAEVALNYVTREQLAKEITVVSKEYFKQMTFIIPTTLPGIYGLKVKRFNRKTSDDVLRFLTFFKNDKPNGPMAGLILDMRGNPGGPPLAAREISSFFLTPGELLTSFQKHDQEPIELDVPEIPEKFHVRVPMVILIDNDSGSAAEMFAGIMQFRKRAVLMGENSAGQVMLKSMFHFSDESMVLLITQRGHYPDGSVYTFDGLTPERYGDQMGGDDIVNYASKYLIYMNTQKKNE